ncbi:MAG: hypothetical protein WA792_02475 [Pseudolabrys sp.]|jgi:hypothetical protein
MTLNVMRWHLGKERSERKQRCGVDIRTPPDGIIVSLLCSSVTIRNFAACACPARRIRNHLLLIDLAIWFLIILAALLVWGAV